MKKIFGFFTFFVFTFSLNAFALTASFDKKVSVKGAVLFMAKVVIQNQNYRLEPQFQDQENIEGLERIITLRNAEGVFSYFPNRNQAIRMSNTWTQIDIISALQDFSQYLEDLNAKRIGTETLEDYECDVYSYQDPTYRTDNKVWVWKEHNFPIKIEMDNDGLPQTIEFSNINLGFQADDSLFEVPAGTPTEEDIPLTPQSVNDALPRSIFAEEEPSDNDLIG